MTTSDASPAEASLVVPRPRMSGATADVLRKLAQSQRKVPPNADLVSDTEVLTPKTTPRSTSYFGLEIRWYADAEPALQRDQRHEQSEDDAVRSDHRKVMA
jgi:hypothetical protein